MSRAFDNNRIAIRERGMLEIMDLALAVLRDGGMPLLAAFAVGAAPMMVLNWLLLGHLTDVPYVEADELPGRYLAMMYLLIGWQIPLASALTTLYLKDAMFVDRPRWSGLWADFRASFSQLFWYQVIKRGLFIAPALLAVAAENYGLAFFLWFLAFVPFARRPYLNEIILLERNPLSTRDKRRMTTAKRAGHVHQTVALAGLAHHGRAFDARHLACDVDRRQPARRHVDFQSGGLLAFAAAECVDRDLLFFRRPLPGLPRPADSPRRLGSGTDAARRSGTDDETRDLAGRPMQRRIHQHEPDRCYPMASRALAVLIVLLGAVFAPGDHYDDPGKAIEGGRDALGSSWSYPWYDRDKDALRRLEVEPPKPPPAPPATGTAPGGSGIGNWLLMFFGWGLLAIVIVALVTLMVRMLLDRDAAGATGSTVARSPDRSQADRVESLPFDIKRPQSDLLGQAQDHRRRGEYGEAIIYLYSYLLVELDKAQVIHLARGKTNREYLRETRRAAPLDSILEPSMIAFEDVFFGHYELPAARFEACWSRLGEFQQAIQSRVAQVTST